MVKRKSERIRFFVTKSARKVFPLFIRIKNQLVEDVVSAIDAIATQRNPMIDAKSISSGSSAFLNLCSFSC